MASLARYYQSAKNGVHGLQALIIFIGMAMTIAIFTKDTKPDGRLHYYFALCWVCFPILVYQTAVPSFERTKRFANIYCHAAFDAVLAILWFAAFIAVAVWIHQGSRAAKDWKKGDHNCEKFAWGPVSECKLGQGTTVLGAFLCLLFALTTAFSIYGISYYRSNGSLPGKAAKSGEPLPQDEEQQEDYAFSANPHDRFDEHEETQMIQPNPQHEDLYASYHTEAEPHPEGPTGWDHRSHSPAGEGFDPVDTSYHGSGSGNGHEAYDPHLPPPRQPSPLDPFHDDGRSPSPQYNTLHSNESNFVGRLNPHPHLPPPRTTAGDPFRDDLALSHDQYGRHASGGGGQIPFPDANYDRH